MRPRAGQNIACYQGGDVMTGVTISGDDDNHGPEDNDGDDGLGGDTPGPGHHRGGQ